MEPRISIVTISFNNLDELKLTCIKIDEQEQLPFEHYIIDGSSTSEIKEWLENTQQPTYRKWLCEPDKGISDAFNKGIQRSTGDIIHLQNSGDYYYDEKVLKLVTDAFVQQPEIQWLHGKYAMYRGGIWLVAGKPFEVGKLYRGMRTIGHPTMFLRRQLYDKYGLFEVNKKIAMDYDMLIRIAREPFVFLDRPLVYFTPGGVSEDKLQAALKEIRESYFRYKGKSLLPVLWGWRILLLNAFTRTFPGRLWFRIKNRNKMIQR